MFSALFAVRLPVLLIYKHCNAILKFQNPTYFIPTFIAFPNLSNPCLSEPPRLFCTREYLQANALPPEIAVVEIILPKISRRGFGIRSPGWKIFEKSISGGGRGVYEAPKSIHCFPMSLNRKCETPKFLSFSFYSWRSISFTGDI